MALWIDLNKSLLQVLESTILYLQLLETREATKLVSYPR